MEHAPRQVPLALALFVLALGLAHLAFVPGTVVDGQRYGWDDHLWLPGDLPFLLTWPLGLLADRPEHLSKGAPARPAHRRPGPRADVAHPGPPAI
jgi:hypothetical protein